MKLHKYTATVIDNGQERSFEIDSYALLTERKRDFERECAENDWVLVKFKKVA